MVKIISEFSATSAGESAQVAPAFSRGSALDLVRVNIMAV